MNNAPCSSRKECIRCPIINKCDQTVRSRQTFFFDPDDEDEGDDEPDEGVELDDGIGWERSPALSFGMDLISLSYQI